MSALGAPTTHITGRLTMARWPRHPHPAGPSHRSGRPTAAHPHRRPRHRRFSNPANLDTDALPPGLENWDPTPYFNSAIPVFAAVLGTNLSHEIGHRVAVGAQGLWVRRAGRGGGRGALCAVHGLH